VDDAVGVGMLQSAAYLPCHRQRLIQRVGLALIERRPVQPLHDDEGALVGLAGVVDADDVGMVQLGSRLGLAQQTGAALRAQARVGEDLDGHVAAEQRVVGLIDHAHAPPANLRVQAITLVQEGTDHVRHFATNTVVSSKGAGEKRATACTTAATISAAGLRLRSRTTCSRRTTPNSCSAVSIASVTPSV